MAAAEEGGLEAQLIDLVAVFLIAAGVGIFVAKVGRFPYTIALLIAGVGASVIGVGFDIELTHDVILLVVLPPLLFEGAATTDIDVFRRDFPTILTVAVVGLTASILLVGAVSHFAFDFPVLIALLFATIVLPTDPVSVLALFEEMGAPERLQVLVEGESLINDGVAVVVFSTLLTLQSDVLRGTVTVDELADPGLVAGLLADIAVVSVGGAAVGFVTGYGVYRVMADLDDHMTEIVLTVVLAYGSFLVAEHYLHVSGVIATVVAGLLIGNRGREYAMSPRTKIAVFNTWETAAFVVNTFIFVLLGVATPIGRILDHAELLVPAIVVVLVARAVAVYPLTGIVNRVSDGPTVPRSYQHVMVWGGLHGSIPIALVLGLPRTVALEGGGTVAFPFREELQVLVFGVAAFSLVVQGLTVGRLVEGLGITTAREERRLYQLLIARARAVDEALEEVERLHENNAIQRDVYERFRTEYGKEKEDLAAAISALLEDHPELRRDEILRGERQILTSEESAIRESELSGEIGTDVAEELLDEIRIKQDWIEQGRTTVTSSEQIEGYEEFWRERVAEYGLFEGEGSEDDPDPSPTD
ncbi:sodium:proton antiporter [Halobacteriales archaeon QS_8_69_26]|nr:MAG: sodium:proton antiporter [Halobacteriales archaeon QS_8_69_26]